MNRVSMSSARSSAQIVVHLRSPQATYGGLPFSRRTSTVLILYFIDKKTKENVIKFVGCGDRIRTYDLRVMSPTSFHCSTPQNGLYGFELGNQIKII